MRTRNIAAGAVMAAAALAAGGVAIADQSPASVEAKAGAVAAANNNRIPEQLESARAALGGALTYKTTTEQPGGTVSKGILTDVPRGTKRNSVCVSVTFHRGGGSVGCQPSDSDSITKPIVGVTYLGGDVYGLDATLPPGASAVSLSTRDGRGSVDLPLKSDSVVIESNLVALGTLKWRSASGEQQTFDVAALAAETSK